ncbi:hypothetical protein V1517DRAFT_323391, partial [Lipomyces orientalis]
MCAFIRTRCPVLHLVCVLQLVSTWVQGHIILFLSDLTTRVAGTVLTRFCDSISNSTIQSGEQQQHLSVVNI